MEGCRPLEDEEVKAIFKALSKTVSREVAKRNQAIFALAIGTGFRITEVLSLKVRDVYQAKRVMKYVHRPASNMKGKKKGRRVSIHGDTREILEKWVKHLLKTYGQKGSLYPDLYLFQSPTGPNRPIHYTTFHNELHAARIRAGIPASRGEMGTHMLRKTYAKRVYTYYERKYAQGNLSQPPLVLTQIALGHQNINSTLKYLSFITDDIPADEIDIFGHLGDSD